MKKKRIALLTLALYFIVSVTSCGSKTAGYDNNGKYVDLHAHLDGSITVDIAEKLAEMQNIDVTSDDKELKNLLTVSEDCTSLNEFLECFNFPCSLMQTYDGLKEAAYLVAEDMLANGIVYAEIRFAPQNHTNKDMTQEDAVNAVLEGIKKSSLKANVILCCMRGEGNEEQNLETVEIAKKHLVEDGGVVAIDLAGAEALFPTENYRELFEKAKEYNIPFTFHAGEADGADSVRLAIEYGATRIGHGVRIFEDESVVKLVKDKGIYLEMCPTSNRQTAAIKDMRKYPFIDYLSQGIKVTLNTDDPAIEGTTISNEFKYMEEHFGLTSDQKKTVLNNSIEAAFTTDAVKKKLKKELNID